MCLDIEWPDPSTLFELVLLVVPVLPVAAWCFWPTWSICSACTDLAEKHPPFVESMSSWRRAMIIKKHYVMNLILVKTALLTERTRFVRNRFQLFQHIHKAIHARCKYDTLYAQWMERAWDRPNRPPRLFRGSTLPFPQKWRFLKWFSWLQRLLSDPINSPLKYIGNTY